MEPNKQYCDTSIPVVDKMLSRLKETGLVLEPQAGNGVIVKKLVAMMGFNNVDFCEINHRKANTVHEETGANFKDWDFTKLPFDNKYKYIVSVPPFDGKQWENHVYKSISHLLPGGMAVILLPCEALRDTFFINFIISHHAKIEIMNECACDYQCDTFILEIVK